MQGKELRARAEKLLPACNAGDKAAINQLAVWCLPRVRRTVALSHSNPAEHDDLVQVAMAKVFSKLHTYRGDASFFVWIDRVTINVIKDSYKKKRFLFFADNPEDFDLRVVENTKEPEAEFEKYRMFEKLQQHFATIPVKRRLPLVLFMFQGYTVPEIAAMLDVSFDTAKMRLRRGRGELLERLRKDPYCAEAIRGWKNE